MDKTRIARLRHYLHDRHTQSDEYLHDCLDEIERLQAETPDYCYDANAWEGTYPWGEREEIFTSDYPENEILEIACLKELPPKFVVIIDDQAFWFDSKKDAQKVLDLAKVAEEEDD